MFRVRGTLRRRWMSALVGAGIVAVVSGTVLTLAAGARRIAVSQAVCQADEPRAAVAELVRILTGDERA